MDDDDAAPIVIEEDLTTNWSKEGSHVQIDLIEWWCHRVMQSEEPEVMRTRAVELQRAMTTLKAVHSYGRLFNRLQVTGLVHLVCGRSATQAADGDCDDDDVETLSAWNEHQWSDLREQLILAKSYFLRSDADLLVLPFVGCELPPHDDQLDADLESLEIFNQQYKSLLALVSLHKVVAQTRARLSKLYRDTHQRQNERGAKSYRVLLKQLEKIIDDYKANLSDLSLDDETKLSLTSFLLPDLYKSKHDSLHNLPQKLCGDIQRVMSSQEKEFSYTSLQGKLRLLLVQWCDDVLKKPTLVRMGYGTKQAPLEELEDRCSVSSWGDMEEGKKEEEQNLKDVQELVQTMLDSKQLGASATSASEPIQVLPPRPHHSASNTQKSKLTDGDERMEVEEDEEEPLMTQPPPKVLAEEPTQKEVNSDEEEGEGNAGTKPCQTGETEVKEADKGKVEEKEEEPLLSQTKEARVPSLPIEAVPEEEEATLLTQAPESQPPEPATEEKETEEPQNFLQPLLSQASSPAKNSAQAEEASPLVSQDEGEKASRVVASLSTQSASSPSPQGATKLFSKESKRSKRVTPKKRRHGGIVVQWDPSSDEDGIQFKRAKPLNVKKGQVLSSGVLRWPSLSDDEDDQEGLQRRTSSSNSQQNPHGSNGPKQRRRFTDEEKEAIIRGVNRHGVGNWILIINESKGVLNSRSGTQIKDCYRTMLRQQNDSI